MKLPEEGQHEIYCDECHKDMGKVTHFGGDKQLEMCEWCAELKHQCAGCFLAEMERIEYATYKHKE